VGKPKETEEEQKIDIFEKYSECRNALSPEQLKVYFHQLCESVLNWYTNYLSYRLSKSRLPKADEIGVEIVETLNRMVKKEINEKYFFGYLISRLENAIRLYYREKQKIERPIDYPRKLDEMEKLIIWKESNAGRKLTDEEKADFLSDMYKILPIEKARKRVEMINKKNMPIAGSEFFNNDDEEDEDEQNISGSNTESLALNNFYMALTCEAVKSVLSKKQERTKKSDWMLITKYLIDEYPNFLDGLAPVLNPKILNIYKENGITPTQAKIYLMDPNHDAKEDSAEALASKRWAQLFKELSDAQDEIINNHKIKY